MRRRLLLSLLLAGLSAPGFGGEAPPSAPAVRLLTGIPGPAEKLHWAGGSPILASGKDLWIERPGGWIRLHPPRSEGWLWDSPPFQAGTDVGILVAAHDGPLGKGRTHVDFHRWNGEVWSKAVLAVDLSDGHARYLPYAGPVLVETDRIWAFLAVPRSTDKPWQVSWHLLCLRSEDAGRTWAKPIEVAHLGRVEQPLSAFAWSSEHLSLFTSGTRGFRSRDGGRSWETECLAFGPPESPASCTEILTFFRADGESTLLVYASHPNERSGETTYACVRSEDAGRTWPKTLSIPSFGEGFGCPRGRFSFAACGRRLFLAFLEGVPSGVSAIGSSRDGWEKRQGDHWIQLLESGDAGTTWKPSPLDERLGQASGVALGASPSGDRTLLAASIPDGILLQELLPTPAPSPSDPALREAAAGWVARLGDPDPGVREEASRKLLLLGLHVPDLLRKACDSPDAEVKARAVRILDDLRWPVGPEAERKAP